MPCSDLRFLLVEDHPVQRRVATTLLTRLGAAAVHTAEDGNGALSVLRDPARPVDIVLSDISMPGMDGVELVRHLAAASSQVSLILHSALEATQLAAIAEMARAYQVHLLGVIPKPLAAVKLVPLVQRHRERQSQAARQAFSLAELARGWERGEFEPLFEPRCNLASAEVVGCHATPHWRHPQQGLLAPQAFMDAIDTYGLHDEMVWTMLAASLAECGRWRAQGLALGLSVSLSLASLAEAGLPERVTALARESAVPPACVLLGLRGNSLAADPARALGQLSRLRRAGFGLAIEDYAAHSPWADLLGNGLFSQLRISRNLVAGLRGDPSGQAGLAVALDAASQHGLATVARGVASLDDWNLLQDWGAGFAEGALIGAPMPGAQLPAWLQARGRRARALGPTGHALDLGLPGAGEDDDEAAPPSEAG